MESKRQREGALRRENWGLRWAQCLVAAIAAVVAHNDVDSWRELYGLPKSVLRGQNRWGAGKEGGEAETKGNTTDTCLHMRR